MKDNLFSWLKAIALLLGLVSPAPAQYFSLETPKIYSPGEKAAASLSSQGVSDSVFFRAYKAENDKVKLNRKLIGGKWCYIDETGKIIDTPKLEEIWNFSGGPARIEICEDGEDLKTYYIDTLGTILSFKSESKRQFSEGLTRVVIEGAWSYVDTTGRIVILPLYVTAGDFSEGLAPVLLDGELNYIDKTGKVVSQVATKKEAELEGFYQTGDTLNVLANSGLALKNKPTQASKTLSIVPYGEHVFFIGDKKEKRKMQFEVEGIVGYWILVKFGNVIGYLFDGFLSKLPAPPKDCIFLQQYVAEKLIGVGKRDTLEWARNICDEKFGGILYVQKLKYDAIIEIGFGWEEMTVTLKIPNIKLEEGFLIAKLCTGSMFENEVFPKNSTHVQIDKYDIASDYRLEIIKNLKKQVEISLRISN